MILSLLNYWNKQIQSFPTCISLNASASFFSCLFPEWKIIVSDVVCICFHPWSNVYLNENYSIFLLKIELSTNLYLYFLQKDVRFSTWLVRIRKGTYTIICPRWFAYKLYLHLFVKKMKTSYVTAVLRNSHGTKEACRLI